MSSAQATPQITPAAAWQLLATGNERFVAGTPRHPHTSQWRRNELAGGQHPFAIVVSCSDSRVPPEIVFDRGLGDLFTIRTAGHVLDSAVLGTVEYGVEHCGSPLLVVLGHEACGCVAAAAASAQTGEVPGGYIGHLVEAVGPALEIASETGTTNLGEVMEQHVRQVVAGIVEQSETVAEYVRTGKLAIAGLTYRLSDGKVTLLDWMGDLGRAHGAAMSGSVVRAQNAASAAAVAVVDAQQAVDAEVVEDELASH